MTSDLREDFDDFFENALSGFLYANPRGEIDRANARLAGWLGVSPAELKGKRLTDFLTVAGKIYYETNLAPLLRMQGHFDEVALELLGRNGEKLPVLVCAMERCDDGGTPLFIRTTVYRATDRRKYERNLLEARSAAMATSASLREKIADEVKDRLAAEGLLVDERHTSALREQFIAVLSHDLRNPLASIDAGMRALRKTPLTDTARTYTELIQKSVARMAELISNTIDFARGRLGSGLSLNREDGPLAPALMHVIEELRIAWPDRTIDVALDQSSVNCDKGRIAQLLSNLVANALTHGSSEEPVRVRSATEGHILSISVVNRGAPIPPDVMGRLFQPFTRDEMRPSQMGLGLGLFIAFEIAKAHGGTIEALSTPDETRFTFQMPVEQS